MKANTNAPIFLISDNNNWVARLTKWRLETLVGREINVIIGHNGEDAINLFEDIVRKGNHSRLQLVLLGCHMPVYTGMQAVEEIRNIEQRHHISCPVEIIGTTADLNEEVHSAFVSAGTNFVLSKPVPEGELEDLCTAILIRRAATFNANQT